MFGGDDDDDFMPVTSSKLASLFSSKPTTEGNTSLTYTAPKQPKRGGSIKNESRSSTKTQTTGGSTVSASSTQHSSSNTLGIIVVKVVNTYKLEEGSYNLQGKLGAAVLGNASVCIYQLLLYKGKQHHVTSCKITPKFQYTVQANNYGTFYDEHKQNWSIHFDNAEAAEEFAKEIGLARGCAQGSSSDIQSLLTQDVTAGEGPDANVGDSVEVFYSVRLFTDGKMGQLVETNMQADKPQRVKIRKNVWEEGLLGAKKGSKRIILLPPNLAGPWKQEVPLNASLVVEIEVYRLKQSKGSREGTPILLTSTVDSAESAVDSSTDETSIKARGASISEALTASPKTHKANIISRMAKMGQATLPLKGAIACNPSDSDSENEGNSSPKPPIIFKPTPKVRSPKAQSKSPKVPSPPDNPPSGSAAPQHVTMYQAHPGWQQQPQAYMMGQFSSGNLEGPLYSVMGNHTINSHQLMPAAMATTVGTPSGMPSADSQLLVFLSENRTHNTEVRIGMAKVADKVDQVLAKLDSVHSVRPATSNALLDSTTLLASIQKLVSENEQLKAELVDKGNKIEIQNDRIYQLLNTNHKYLEQSSAASSHEALVAELQREKIQLLEDLSASKEKLQTLQTQLESCKREKSEDSSNVANQLSKQQEDLAKSKSIIEEQNENVQRLTEKLKRALEAQDCHEKTIATLRNSMQELQNCKDKLNLDLSEVTHQLTVQKLEADEELKILNAKYSSQIATFEMREANYKSTLEMERKATSHDNKIVMDEVKKIMNLVYKTLKREFINGQKYFGENIKEILESTIRDITCQLIEQETSTTSVDVRGQPADSSLKQGSSQQLEDKEVHSVSSLSEHSYPDVNSDPSHHELRDEGNIPSSMTVVEPPQQRVNVIEDSADGPKENSDSYLSVVENCVGGNAGDISTVPLAKLPGETDLSLKFASTDSETLEDTPTHLRVTSDSCVLGASPARTSDESRRELSSTVTQESLTRSHTVPLSTDTVQHDGQQTSANETEEAAGRRSRESSVERKPWRSEPPPAPLFDDDEDEDDWLT